MSGILITMITALPFRPFHVINFSVRLADLVGPFFVQFLFATGPHGSDGSDGSYTSSIIEGPIEHFSTQIMDSKWSIMVSRALPSSWNYQSKQIARRVIWCIDALKTLSKRDQ